MDTLTRRLVRAFWGSPRRAAITTSGAAAALVVAFVNVPAITQMAGWLLIGSPFALFVGAFPNESKQLFGRSLAIVAGLHDRFELESVRQDIEGTLSIGAGRLRSRTTTGTVPDLRLDYLRSEGDVELLPDGTVIVGIARHHNRERNLVGAAWAFAQHGVLVESRPYLDPDVSVGLDLVVAKELLEPAGARVIATFLRTVWSPAVVGQQRLKDLSGKLEVIHANRLLGPIALAEFHDLATSLGFRFPTEVIATETAEFVDYLYEIACREPGTNLGDNSNFEGGAIRCRILYVARPEIYAVKGPAPHRSAIDWAIRRAYHRVYLLASGRNISYVREVLQPYSTDSRVASLVELSDTRILRSGRSSRLFVFRISVDVRYRVGIGQRPIVAVGPGRQGASPSVTKSKTAAG